MPIEYVEMIEQAAQLHDVGKIGIPDAILLKPDKLTPAEFDVMKKHCELGLKVLSPRAAQDKMQASCDMSMLLQMAREIAVSHHEKWDGSGYPAGLAGEQIPLVARIVAVADVFDALTSKRPYKPAFSLEKSQAIIAEGRGKHFDPQVADAFLASMDEVVAIATQYAD
jgi:response regulator RpfG family c-di-GMP phosphodiesterase